MSNIIFIGDNIETYPFNLIGLETFVPPEDIEDLSWIEHLSQGRYSVIFISERTFRSRPDAMRSLNRKLRPGTAMTCIPDPVSPESEHLHFVRLKTVRALGVDNWTGDRDFSAGENP